VAYIATVMPVPVAVPRPAPAWTPQDLVGYVKSVASVTMASCSAEEHVCKLKTVDVGLMVSTIR